MKGHAEEIRKEVSDMAVHLHGWEEIQWDETTKMIGFKKKVNGQTVRINFYCTKKTIVIQSKLFKGQKTYYMKFNPIEDIQNVFGHPLNYDEWVQIRNKEKQIKSKILKELDCILREYGGNLDPTQVEEAINNCNLYNILNECR